MAITCVVALPAILEYLPGFVGTMLNIARWPVLAVLVAVALSCIYRYGPSRDTPQWRWITWGSAFAAVAWLIASAVFSFYAANFGTFQQDLRLARRRHGLHAVDLDLEHRDPARRQAERRDGAPDGARQHRRAAGADGRARRQDGRHGRRGAGAEARL